jgi:hypothetical protein
MKKIFFAVLLVVCLSLVGCMDQGGNGTPELEVLEQEMIQANNQIKTYSVQSQVSADMKTTAMGQEVEMTTSVNSEGQVDKENGKMHLNSVMSMDMGEFLGSNSQTSLQMETYVIGNEVYIKGPDEWMKMTGQQAIDYGSSQDQFGQTLELANMGEITSKEQKQWNGKNYYVLTVNVDPMKMYESFFASQSMPTQQKQELQDSIKDYSLTLWVNTQTFVMEKIESYILMEVQKDQQTLTLETTTQTIVSNINEPVQITLPDEALNAEEISAIEDQTVTPITGNVVSGMTS